MIDIADRHAVGGADGDDHEVVADAGDPALGALGLEADVPVALLVLAQEEVELADLLLEIALHGLQRGDGLVLPADRRLELHAVGDLFAKLRLRVEHLLRRRLRVVGLLLQPGPVVLVDFVGLLDLLRQRFRRGLQLVDARSGLGQPRIQVLVRGLEGVRLADRLARAVLLQREVALAIIEQLVLMGLVLIELRARLLE
ncbi:MAG: hypothetical protein ACYTGK_20670, partial [Planctomycetota bacterium]